MFPAGLSFLRLGTGLLSSLAPDASSGTCRALPTDVRGCPIARLEEGMGEWCGQRRFNSRECRAWGSEWTWLQGSGARGGELGRGELYLVRPLQWVLWALVGMGCGPKGRHVRGSAAILQALSSSGSAGPLPLLPPLLSPPAPPLPLEISLHLQFRPRDRLPKAHTQPFSRRRP